MKQSIVYFRIFPLVCHLSLLLSSRVQIALCGHVGCGSVVKLTHLGSGGDFTLSSSSQSWGGGSGQQVVTLVSDKAEHSTLWQVREGNGEPQCHTGTAIKCGQVIRLTHLLSKKNLHTHHIPSAISRQQEVSGFGEEGEGDHGDDWKVLCSGKTWQKGQTVRFEHVGTSAYLGASQNFMFNEQNCRNCPILNHMEVVGTRRTDETTHFKASLGIFLSV